MKSSWLLIVPVMLLAPLVLALSAFFAGLWQAVPEQLSIDEDELGT